MALDTLTKKNQTGLRQVDVGARGLWGTQEEVCQVHGWHRPKFPWGKPSVQYGRGAGKRAPHPAPSAAVIALCVLSVVRTRRW